MFGKSPAKTGEDGDDDDPEHGPDIHFEPIVQVRILETNEGGKVLVIDLFGLIRLAQ